MSQVREPLPLPGPLMANQKGRGTRAENAVGDELGAAGFDVIRSAASKGAADLVAVGDWGVVFVQVKLGAQGKPFKMPSPAERRELLRIVRRAGGLAVAACRIPGSGPRAARTEWRVLFADGGPRDWHEWHPGHWADNQSIKTEFLRDQIVQESARDKLLSVLRGQAEECYCDNPNCTPPEALVDAFEAELAQRSSSPHPLADQAALRQAEAKLDSVQALAMAWSRPTMSAPTRVAGEHLTRLLADEPDPEGIQQ